MPVNGDSIRLAVLVAAVVSVGSLAGCGGAEFNGTDRLEKSPAMALDAPATGDGTTISGQQLSRNALLQELLLRDQATLHSGLPAERLLDLDLHSVSTASVLNALLDDVGYRASFAPTDQQHLRVTDLWIGVQAEGFTDSLGGQAAGQVAASAALATAEVEAVLSTFDSSPADEVLMLVDEVTLSAKNLAAMDAILTRSVSTQRDEQLQVAIMQRLDLANEYGAKGVILQSLGSDREAIVSMALDSIDVWHDPSVADRLLVLNSHPNRRIRERAQQMREDLAGSESMPEIPRDMRTAPSSIEALTRRESPSVRAD